MTTATAPVKPHKNGRLENLYLLFYRFGTVPSLQAAFEMPDGSSMQEAINAGRTYCVEMNYRFLYVTKFLKDFNEDIQRKRDPQHSISAEMLS